MLTTHTELMDWLAKDDTHVHRFLKALDKVVNGRVVLITDSEDDGVITGFMASRHKRKARR